MECVTCSFCGSDRADEVLLLRDYAFDLEGEFPLVRCSECGLLYLRERPAPAEIGSYYPEAYLPYKKAIDEEPWRLVRWVRRWNTRKYRRVVEAFSPRVPGAVMDVGCSTGIFLTEMQHAGWEIYGVEPNAGAGEYARRRLGQGVLTGTLDQVAFPDGTFVAITFWDVLEHTPDPRHAIHLARRLLEDNGIIVIAVPNYASLDRHLFGRYWVGYDAPRHFYVFTASVLTKMLEEAGFTIAEVRCAFGGYHTTVASLRLWLRQHARRSLRTFLTRLIDMPGMRLPFYPLERITDALGVGAKLLVVARKA